MPSLVRVATQLPDGVERVRLIDIDGFDVQADGGTHVRSTGEVGPVTLGRLENKGARNKRLYPGTRRQAGRKAVKSNHGTRLRNP